MLSLTSAELLQLLLMIGKKDSFNLSSSLLCGACVLTLIVFAAAMYKPHMRGFFGMMKMKKKRDAKKYLSLRLLEWISSRDLTQSRPCLNSWSWHLIDLDYVYDLSNPFVLM